MLKVTKTRINESETKIEFSDKIIVPREEVDEFIERLEKFISEFAI